MKRISVFVCVLAGLIASVPTLPVRAETVPPGGASDDSGGIQEIVVTARKRSEDLQATPVAVTAFSQRDLEIHGVKSVENLTAQTPSLVFQQSPYDPMGSEIGLRGQQSTDIIITQTPPVGIYVDDVYYPTTLATSLENFAGVQQVEVLKGPQGTLYGRNTTGGAIRITTALPDYSGVSGHVSVGYGNYDHETVSGGLNLPIIDNKVALNLIGQFSKDDGYGRDLSSGTNLQQNKSEAFRAALRIDPTDQLEIIVRGEWAHAAGTSNIEELRYVVPGFSIASAAVATQVGALTPADFGVLGALLTTGAPPAGATPAQIGAFFADVNKGRTALANSICPQGSQCRNIYYPTQAQAAAFGQTTVPIYPDVTVDLSTASISGTYQFTPDFYGKSVTAFETTKRASFASTSASPFLLIDGVADEQDPRQFTEELQIGGNALDSSLKWVGGYYYFNLKGYDNGINLELVPLLPNPISNTSNLDDKSNSAYGQATYAINSDLHATLGARYTSEKTTLRLGNHNALACDVPGIAATGEVCSNSFDNSFDKLSYTAGIDWQAMDHLLLYVKTSTGFRAGGTNQRSNPALDYAPETVTDYEIGAKSEWLDRRLRANLAIYHSNYKDIQRSVYVDEANSFVTEIQNAASAKINGAELELTARPIRPLTLSASAAYTAPKYDKYNGFTATGATIDLSSNRFPNVSRWQGDLSANYVLTDALGDLNGNVDYSFRSFVDYQPDNHDAVSAAYTTQAAYGLINARISQNIASSHVDLSIWGKNLANREYSAGANDFSTQLGYAYSIPGLPRTYGVEVRMSF